MRGRTECACERNEGGEAQQVSRKRQGGAGEEEEEGGAVRARETRTKR